MSGIDNRPGSELIIGRYRILYPLQEGGFGETFLVEDIHLPSQRRCVLKLLKPVHDNPEFYKLIKDRFQREAAIQETLGEACIHIPRLYAYFSDSDRFYLVEEWIDGETLTTKVAEVGRFSEVAVAEILSQLLLTIDTVHQHQIIHRDIKPDNIILRRRDGKPILIDFGAVKESMGTTLESQGGRSIVIGTASYMAPEQSVGRPIYASDLYSLGLTAVYLLSGRSPGEMDHDPHTGKVAWRSQVPQVSEELAKIIETAIQSHPQDRYASAQDMFQALQMLQAGTLLEDIPTLISRPPSGNASGQNAIPSAPGRQPSEPPVAQAQTPNFPVPNVPIPIPQVPTPQVPTPQVQNPPIPQSQPQYQNLQQNLSPTPQQNSQPPTAQDPPQSSNSADLQTIVTSRNESLMNTQVVSPGAPSSNVQSNSSSNRNSSNAASQQIPLPSGNRDWLKAALIGGGVGGGLLLGVLLLRGQPSGVVVTPTPSASPSVVTSVSPSVSATPTPSGSAESPQPSKAASPEPDTAEDTCGDVSGSGDWYPVFINNADVRQVRRKYCRDAIAKTRDNGTPAVQVASFTDQQRAVDFADRVGGEVGEPYKVASSKPSSNPDETPPKAETPPKKNDPPPKKTETNPKTGDTNAVIIGDSSSKNIRRGPGSEFPVQHIAYPGDRVQITGSEQDSGGYVWYKVYFPKSGASGWIAGQLIQPD
jgi:serine/threonine protein kinase, bacterial